ncbi:MAG: hypothetical protein JXR96_02915 [Deltaproteobacteria bacterium]|nr:hypothetical protein [Deltaproteobacteria bacterium]
MIRKATLFSLIGALVLLAPFASADEKKVIAVGEVKAIGCSSSHYYSQQAADAIAANLRTRIAETRAFKVVSRSQMRKILREHKMEMVGLVESENIKELGKFLQADFIMGIEITCTDRVAFNVNLWDVETAESAWAKAYEMRSFKKTSVAIKDIAKMLKDYGKSGKWPSSGHGKTEVLAMLDSKAFHDSAEYIIAEIRRSIPRVSGTIADVNAYDEANPVKLKLGYGAKDAWPGLKLKVTRDDQELGWVYLNDKGGREVKASTHDEVSAFEQGDKVSSEDFEPKIAIGTIEDEVEDNQDLIDLFRERMLKEFAEADGVEPAEGAKIDKILSRMGKSTKKKDLAKLHAAGVDLLIVGRFSGDSGQRRLDFEVLNTVNGRRVIKVKRDRIGL